MAAVPPARPRRADHASATRGRPTTACCTSSGSCCGPTRASSPRPPASLLLFAAGITSYRLARRRMAYETWWSVHLYTYLALFLSFSHQVDTGASFVGHPRRALLVDRAVARDARASSSPRASGCRVWRSLRHQVRVVGATPEGPGVVSIVLRGRRLDRLPVAGGQFFQWRFLRRGLWWQAHPYSLSAAPSGDELRITVKDLGDHSAGLARLRARDARRDRRARTGPSPPTRAERDRVLLVGAGRRHRADPRAARRSCRRTPTSPCCCARSTRRGPRPARRGRRRGPPARRPPRRARRPARRGAPRRRRAAPDRPRRARAATSTSAAPTPSRGSSPPSSSAPASPERRIHFESFTF